MVQRETNVERHHRKLESGKTVPVKRHIRKLDPLKNPRSTNNPETRVKSKKSNIVEIYPMMRGYYFVIRDKNYKITYSSPIYKNRSEAKRKADEYTRGKR